MRAFCRVKVVIGIRPPLPLEPQAARQLGVQIAFDREPHVARETLRARADQEVVIRDIHHLLRHLGRRFDPLEAGDPSRALPGTVHAARIQLDDTLRVRQTAVTDARVRRIELDDVDAGDERVEDVPAGGHRRKREFDGRLRAAVLEAVAVCGRNDDRLDAARADSWSLGKGRAGRRDQSAHSGGFREFTAAERLRHGVPTFFNGAGAPPPARSYDDAFALG